jgi:hypothetical protein
MAVTEADTVAVRRPGPVTGWLRADPVRAVALALIAVQVAVRAEIAAPGFLVSDDFVLAERSTELGLKAEYLLGMFNNHLMPGGLFITWLVTRTAALEYWPYLLIMLTAQAVLSLAFYRLLRLLFQPRAGTAAPAAWGMLIPLCLFLFSPLTLEATAWWAVAANQLPMQLAMVLAIGAQVRYARTGRNRHLLTLGAALVFGLLFFEKSLLVVPLVFLWTACLLVDGGIVHSVVQALRRFWRSWLVLSAVTLVYLVGYFARAATTVREPASTGEVLTFVRQIIGSTLVPGLIGGPWRWLDAGDGPPVTAPAEPARWISWAVFLGLIVVTVRMHRIAIRAWVLLALYVAITIGLLGATRLGLGYSAVAGLVPRYVSDVVVVAALCVGVAVLGLASAGTAGRRDAAAVPAPAAARASEASATITSAPHPAVLVVALVALLGSASWTAARFGDDWAVKSSRDYLRTAQAELAAAPVGTVFFDAPVPDVVISTLSRPYNLQSKLFQYLSPRPQFVTTAENPSIFDAAGHIRRVRIDGATTSRPGPDVDCGYRARGGQTVRITLPKSLDHRTWAVRFAYIGSGASPATLYFGGTLGRFETKAGLNHIHFVMDGGGDAFELTLADPNVSMCAGDVAVGHASPQQ